MSAAQTAPYADYAFAVSELPHRYGAQVHLLADPILLTQLAQLCRPETVQPGLGDMLRDLYRSLARTVMAAELPRSQVSVRTRMFNASPHGVWHGAVLDPSTSVVTVDIARAGTQPSQIVFETLNRLLNPQAVRQDHIYMNRVCDAAGQVVGVEVAGSKIGGPVGDAFVLVPDPMGATGGSMRRTVAMYKNLEGGTPRKIIALHLIVTPEYLKALHCDHPDVVVYALRLDRGMSPPQIMGTPLGAHWEQERGLDDRHYIVPGAGGLGEVLNNSYV